MAFDGAFCFSEGNPDDFVAVRVLIEVECARRAGNETDDLVPQLTIAIEEMRTETMDHSTFMDSDARFHLAIAHAARNPSFETVGSTIQSIVRI
ncbi:MAG TPA: FCD domain-containing protein [Roseiarcus sp.]